MSYLLGEYDRHLDVSLNIYKGASISSLASGGTIYYSNLDSTTSHNTFSATLGSALPNPTISLEGGYTYYLEGAIAFYRPTVTNGYLLYQWYNHSTSQYIGAKGVMTDGKNRSQGQSVDPDDVVAEELAQVVVPLSSTTDLSLILHSYIGSTQVDYPTNTVTGVPAYGTRARCRIWRR